MHIIFASNCSYLLATIGFAFFLDLFCTEKWYHVTQFILVSCTALTKLNTLSRMTQQTVDLFCTEKWYLVTQFILVSCRALTKLNTLSRMTQQTVDLFCTEKWYHVTQFILVSCTALTLSLIHI